jgi:hypothetical protein
MLTHSNSCLGGAGGGGSVRSARGVQAARGVARRRSAHRSRSPRSSSSGGGSGAGGGGRHSGGSGAGGSSCIPTRSCVKLLGYQLTRSRLRSALRLKLNASPLCLWQGAAATAEAAEAVAEGTSDGGEATETEKAEVSKVKDFGIILVEKRAKEAAEAARIAAGDLTPRVREPLTF